MAVTPFKTFSAGEILTAADLNSSFSQITSNGEDLGWPATKAKDLNGNELILDGDADTSITADTDDQVDFKLGGVDVLRLNTVLSAVNGIDFTAAATGNAPFFSVFGSDTNVNLDLKPKGTGGARFLDKNGNEVLVGADGAASAVNEITVQNAATGNHPVVSATGGDTNINLDFQPKGTGGVRLLDKNGNEVLVGADGTASAVNEITATNAATSANPKLSATGGDTNIGLDFQPKGTGGVRLLDKNGNEILVGADGTASAVNELTVTNAAAASAPSLSATGGDTNIDVNLVPKGTGQIDIGSGGATQAEMEAATATDKVVTPENLADAMTLETEQATTSGTAFDFTGIRASAKRIIIIFDGVSLSGTDDLLVQLGDSVGFETAGYVSASGGFQNAAQAVRSSTAGFIINSGVAANTNSGHMVLTKMSGNKWIASHQMRSGTTTVVVGGGDKTLSDVLTQVRVTRTGTNTGDAGAVNILVE